MYGYHKLPGGGMEVGESEEVSLKRETSEETGCKIKDIEKIVTIEEIRTHEVVHQLSFCYKAIVDGEKNIQNLQGYEATEGLEIKWLSYIEILQILEKEYPAQPYAGKFMNLRDRIFLEKLI
jgi:ADP-ribose pyrophosphatase YjhB (NUDIX family)